MEDLSTLPALTVPTSRLPIQAPSLAPEPPPVPAMSLVFESEAEWQAALVTAATCPACARLSTRIEFVSTRVPGGMAFAPYCFCINGHSWPHLDLTPGEDD